MKALSLPNAEIAILAIQEEIRRSDRSRYDHRLHSVLLVAQGLNCPEVSRLLGDSPRTVEYWVNRFEERGFAGLIETERPGRPQHLNDGQLAEIGRALQQSPRAVGLDANGWNGKTLSAFIMKRFEIDLKVRQCQRLFRQLGVPRRKLLRIDVPSTPEKCGA